MNDNIFFILTTKIKEGELDNLRSLITEMTDSTKVNEPGTINYEWFISADEKFCHSYERFEHSEATLIHQKNFMKNFAKRYMACLEIKSFAVYGNPSEEIINMLTPLGVVFMKPAGGFLKQ